MLSKPTNDGFFCMISVMPKNSLKQFHYPVLSLVVTGRPRSYAYVDGIDDNVEVIDA